ncbi:Oidioi.mRNA.OKI2018_I69.PAR.g11405.t1.cds [Oikopleura dioica]|uniref:Oidioi.mRNA.OKI2018_I69.PAR.g11405.t1.cds n=1 Tax=Oikopleura dioica TaxID=34765 RepID=A0ABN7RVG4_OIKDI|nr:Oidioi.mRNA.OKI2018_I69.PAR.g11405.t1.cds [Oikopleura dioica]
MGGHGHSHSCGGGCDHSLQYEFSTDFSLYTKINDSTFECLGEEVDGSGRKVFKSYEDRMEKETFVNSDCDPELLFNIPFNGNVKIFSIIIIGGEDGEQPTKVKIFKNSPGMTFDDAQSKTADQEIDLSPDPKGDLQYPLKAAKFSNVFHLSLFFPSSVEDEISKVYYIGLRGEFQKADRDQILVANYELNANPADHKNPLSESSGHQIS